MKDGKLSKIAYACRHFADNVLKSLDRFGPGLTRRAAGRTEIKEVGKENCPK